MADYLFLMTDVDGLYDSNPNSHPSAKRIPIVDNIQKIKTTTSVEDSGSSWGTGGMITKIKAAEWCTIAGCNMIICSSKQPAIILDIMKELESHEFKYGGWDPKIGTHFVASDKMQDRQWWILHSLSATGTIIVDQGCVNAITKSEKISLFAVGITQVQGPFNQLDCILIKSNINGELVNIAKGLVEYSSREVEWAK